MPRLSIVIPATGSIDSLESTLVCVLANRPSDSEIVVVLNQPYGDPYDLGDEVRFLDGGARASALDCIQLGIVSSRSPLVHLLGVGCEVEEGWTHAAVQRFDEPSVAVVAPLATLESGGRDIQIAGLGLSASGLPRALRPPRSAKPGRRSPVAAPLLAGFYRKSALVAVGGFSTAVGASLAHIDTGMLLRAAGYRVVYEGQSQVRLPQRFGVEEGRFTRAFYAERLFWRSAPQTGWLRALLCHPWTVAAEAVNNFPYPTMALALLGRLTAAVQVGHCRRHYQRLAELEKLAGEVAAAQPASIRIDRSHATRPTAGQVKSKAG